MLRKYIHHLVQDSHISVSSDATDHALEPDNFLHTTFHQFMSWKLNEITISSPSPPPSVTASDPRATPSNPSFSSQLLNFKRGIKRDISAYPTLKDEKYYESFKRSVLVTARAHDCEDIPQPTFRPKGDADSLELFRLKNDFMYSVFNKCLLSDMGKTIVRKHLDNMNAQRVWEEFATHMTTSSKSKAEKRRLHTYVTTTVLDKSWKGTTEQFILHFNEQFRQLDEVSPPEESLPYTTRLTLLQTAVHNIPELRMVETMEEFISLSSSTPGPTMGYDNYLTLLQNACIRYDSNIAKNQKQLTRAINQSKIRQVRRSAVYTFGFLIPKDYKQALQLDEQNGNSKWYDATKLEMDQINEYKVFQDHGKAQYDPKARKVSNAPNGYQKIRVHLIFAVKHDGRHKARLVAGGHLTPDPIESIYSGIVSIRSLRLVIFLAKLNNLEVWGADIGNAYLEAKTKEKLYIVEAQSLRNLRDIYWLYIKHYMDLKVLA